MRRCIAVASMLLLAAVPAAAQRYEQIVREHTDTVPFAGVVLVGRGDSIRYVKTLGFANYEQRVATTPDTRYQLGSISKWVCSLALLRLQDEGRVDVRAPLSRYLPAFRRDNAQRLTLHHLMSHTSGVPNDVIPAITRDSMLLRAPISDDEVVRRFASGDLAFEPGARFDYAHSNWLLVRRVIQLRSGRSVAENVRRSLTGPLGLRATGIFTGDFADVPNAAVPYRTLAPAPVRRAMPYNAEFIDCMGGSYSTAPDLLRLMNGVYSGRVLRPATLAAMNAVYAEDQAYGYGGRTRTLDVNGVAHRFAWQSGTSGAFKSVAYRDLADGTTVIILSNTSPGGDMLSELAQALLRESYR